ncbi:transglycosylase SLT domain-containing protein [Paraburkholderia sp. BCC1884]|uniref:transglycosylase SLT domain-containing protein n=1 Tax=Paraburkholderia sp. BCC1884 TaxID=2562668 RepID=UPI001182F8A4|nr:transglycosylase SLT domain-containing protein [Paraburkholderia sp. BCC1884]
MADTPIIEIPVNSAEFDAFVEKFNEYEAKAKAGTADPFAHVAASLRDAGEALGALGAHFDGIASAATTSKMVGPQSFISQWSRGTHQSAKDWELIGKNTDKSQKGLTTIARSWINIKSLRKDALYLGAGAAAGVAAMAKANSDVAKQNLEGRALGLPIGKAQAFESDYGPLGLQRSDLSNFADAKEDSRLWKPLIAAGLSADQIKGMDPDELAIAFARSAGQKYHDWESQGLPAAQVANSMGFNDLLSNGTLRAAGSWSDQQWSATHAKYLNDAQQMGIDSRTADDATSFKQKWSSDLSRVGQEFNKQLVNASGGLGHFADAASNAAIKLLKAAGPWVDKAADGVGNILDTLSDGESFVSPEQGGPQYKQYDVRDGFRKFGDGIRSAFPGIPDVNQPGVTRKSDNNGFTSDPKRDETLRRLERLNNLRPGTLDNFERQESSRGANVGTNTNDSEGPAGAFQLTKATAASVGITNRMDEGQSAMAAAAYLNILNRKYRGDQRKIAASYDGFANLDKAIAKYPKDWFDHLDEFGSRKAAGETGAYLKSMQANGMDFSVDGAYANATNDANLKPRSTGLNESDFRIVDLSKDTSTQRAAPNDSLGDLSGVRRFLALFSEGGGEALRGGSSSKAAPPANPQPVNINVKVSTPAGASTIVTTGGVPH